MGPIEPKRCFVVGQRVRKHRANKRYLHEITEKEHATRLARAKKHALKLPEKKLDKIIADKYKKRLRLYNQMDWYIGEVSISEVGVWNGAGGLPTTWTQRSLKETADKTRKALARKDKKVKARSWRVLPQIIAHKPAVLKEKISTLSSFHPHQRQGEGTCRR